MSKSIAIAKNSYFLGFILFFGVDGMYHTIIENISGWSSFLSIGFCAFMISISTYGFFLILSVEKKAKIINDNNQKFVNQYVRVHDKIVEEEKARALYLIQPHGHC